MRKTHILGKLHFLNYVSRNLTGSILILKCILPTTKIGILYSIKIGVKYKVFELHGCGIEDELINFL